MITIFKNKRLQSNLSKSLDRFKTHIIFICSWLRHNIVGRGTFPKIFGKYAIPSRCRFLFAEHFHNRDMIYIDNNYHIGQPWGNYHPGDLKQWYDPEAIKITEHGLELTVTDNTLDVVVDGKAKIIPHGVGLITSKAKYGYGFYRTVYTQAKGMLLWPAIWMSGAHSWPPEIDIMESYSNERKTYDSVTTNLHAGSEKDNTKYQVGASSFYKPFLKSNFCDQFGEITLDLHWTDKFIKIYVNGYLVRSVKDKFILSSFMNEDGSPVPMNIIFNIAVNKGVEKYKASAIVDQPLTIKTFEVYTA